MGKKSRNRKPQLRAPAAAVQGRKAARLLDEAKHHHQVGELDRAESIYRQVLGQDPENAEALHFLGVLVYQKGEGELAVELMAKAIEKDSGAARYHYNLANIFQRLGRLDEALDGYIHALELQPDHLQARIGLVSILKNQLPAAQDLARAGAFGGVQEKMLLECFASPDVLYQDLAMVTATYLLRKHDIRERVQTSGGISQEFLDALSADRLFISLLERTINVNAELELALTAVRRRLLLSRSGGEALSAPAVRLASALAHQCFSNEYVFWAESDEEERLAVLEREVEAALGSGASPGLERDLLLLAMYAPLSGLRGAGALRRMPLVAWSPHMRPLVERTLIEPEEEAELMQGLPSIGGVADATSHAVRAQYEENPYPRWVGLGSRKKVNLAGNIKWQFPNIEVPAFLRGPVQCLVAGCGTGQEALYIATAYSNVEVLAVDLSRRSLAYAIRMARKLGVRNVQFLQGDILDLAKLGRKFHFISCGGVLHHMERPEAGWDVLTDLLVPDGFMRIGLYSELARRHIVEERRRIQAEGVGTAPPEIRRFRRRLLEEAGRPGAPRYLSVTDIFSMSGCRDLLFHVEEHRCTLPQVARMLAERNLSLLALEMPDAKVKRLFGEQFPGEEALTDLASWAKFEERYPDTFLGMYLFWCRKKAGR